MTAFLEARDVEPARALTDCIERGARGVLFDAGALPAAFFDLRTGVAGETLQKLVNYGLRMAAVVPDLAACPVRFQELAREARRGRSFRVFETRAEAVAWLEQDAP